jgi:hypothetical protein
MIARLLLSIALVALASGCALSKRANPFDRAAKEALEAASRPVTLSVKNASGSDVVVYLVDGTVTQRLGRVGSYGVEQLLIRRDATGGRSLQLLLQEFGSDRSYKPEAIRVFPGDELELSVQPLLTTSHVSVRQSG